MSVLCLGEAIVDLICVEPVDGIGDAPAFRPFPGGAMANVAVAVSRAGGRAALAGGLGDDEWGRRLREGLVSEGVDVCRLGEVAGMQTPVAFIAFEADGEPSFAVYGDGIEVGMRTLDGQAADLLVGAGGLAFGSNTLVGDAERELTMAVRGQALERGLPVCFDPNLRLHRWADPGTAEARCKEACEGAFLVRANAAEAALITGTEHADEAASAICSELGAELSVVTRGPAGAVMRGAAEADHPGVAVHCVNSLGAGDALFGTLLAGFAADGWGLERAQKILGDAVAAGAETCRHIGAR